jgi:hypothetical protein
VVLPRPSSPCMTFPSCPQYSLCTPSVILCLHSFPLCRISRVSLVILSTLFSNGLPCFQPTFTTSLMMMMMRRKSRRGRKGDVTHYPLAFFFHLFTPVFFGDRPLLRVVVLVDTTDFWSYLLTQRPAKVDDFQKHRNDFHIYNDLYINELECFYVLTALCCLHATIHPPTIYK